VHRRDHVRLLGVLATAQLLGTDRTYRARISGGKLTERQAASILRQPHAAHGRVRRRVADERPRPDPDLPVIRVRQRLRRGHHRHRQGHTSAAVEEGLQMVRRRVATRRLRTLLLHLGRRRRQVRGHRLVCAVARGSSQTHFEARETSHATMTHACHKSYQRTQLARGQPLAIVTPRKDCLVHPSHQMTCDSPDVW